MDTFTGMAINPAPLKYAERIGPEPKFCPWCGEVVADDSDPCAECVANRLSEMRAFGYNED